MDLVRDWKRQAARGAGVAALAPIILLLAIVAAGSGGLGGLGSLGQVTGGPQLAETGVELATTEDPLAGADIVGVEVTDPLVTAGTRSAADPGGALASGPGGAGGESSPPAAATPGTGVVPPAGTAPPAAGVPEGVTPAPGAPPTIEPDPFGDVVDPVGGIGVGLPGPLVPTTDDILDLLTRGEP